MTSRIPYIRVPRVIGQIVILIGAIILFFDLSFFVTANRAVANVRFADHVVTSDGRGRFSSRTSRTEIHVTFTDKNEVDRDAEIYVPGWRYLSRSESVNILYSKNLRGSLKLNTWRAALGNGILIALAGMVFWKASEHIIRKHSAKKSDSGPPSTS